MKNMLKKIPELTKRCDIGIAFQYFSCKCKNIHISTTKFSRRQLISIQARS